MTSTKRFSIVFLCLGMIVPAQAATITGRDCGGGNLVCDGTVSCGAVACKNGDELQGTFTNVGLFSIGSGTTVFVAAGIPLVVYASTISIQGTINGKGRGKLGGAGGNPEQNGTDGFGGALDGVGAGLGGPYAFGSASTATAGGGGGYGGAGGQGADAFGGAGGVVYDSTGIITSPISSDDILIGSGGGGGAGSRSLSSIAGGNGGSGGGSIYLESSSITVSGKIEVDGIAGTNVVDGAGTFAHPAAGGGGSGGGILIRAPGLLDISISTLSAAGGNGGDVFNTLGGPYSDPGGGGGGGRIKVFYRNTSFFSTYISTASGRAGIKGGAGGSMDPVPPQAGSSGTISFGVIASSPSGFATNEVYITSIAWTWTAAPASQAYWGDADSTSRLFRIFPSTITLPYTTAQTTAASGASSVVETGLTPNTTYYRLVTSFTDWGDSLGSNIVSTHTLANIPGTATPPFSGMSDSSITFTWTAGSPLNPSYTFYEVQRATDVGFSSPAITFTTALSTTAGGLSVNATYYFRVRAANLDGIATSFSATFATATLVTTPGTPTPVAVSITSATFQWPPVGTQTPYTAEISTDNFFTLVAASRTMSTQATFFSLSPGKQYFVRVKATNLNSVDSLPSNAVSTHTLANIPGTASPVFSGVSDNSLTIHWTAGSPANSGDTIYQVERATDSAFSSPSDSFTTGFSSSPAGLSVNATYYFRILAINPDGIASPYGSTFATATLASIPGTPVSTAVFITSATFVWSNNNPSYTVYTAEISTNVGFLSLVNSTRTTSTQATFTGLSPGEEYFFHVRATNLNSLDTAYSVVASTIPGVVTSTTTLEPTTAPGTPAPDRNFSYDGDAVWSWTAADSAVGILDYTLQIGTLPGANDFFSGNVGNVLGYTATGLVSGKTYYARVQARSNSGVLSVFSGNSQGVVVSILTQQSNFDHPYSWPNPFNPKQGPANIGFSIGAPGDVTLKIYTLQGHLVYEETRSFGTAGNQVWIWSGVNNFGMRVAPGGYVAVLHMGGESVKKLKVAVLY